MTTKRQQTNELENLGSLNTRAMLVDLSISQWHSRRKDERITREVAAKHKTSKNAGNYNKNLLLDVTAPAYDALTSIINEARAYHRANTLPWNDGQGELRILAARNYLDYTKFMREIKSRFWAAVPEFVREAMKPGGYFDKAIENLKGMGNRQDYPANEAALIRLFGIETAVFPLPDSADFRVDLGSDTVNEIRKQIEENQSRAEQVAMRDVWQRTYDTVAHAAKILSEDGGTRTVKAGKKKGTAKTISAPARLTEAFFNNIKAQCELLPRLNLSNDPNLTNMINELTAKVAACDPAFVRKSKTVRAQLASDADKIMQAMAPFMGNGNGNE